MKTRFPTTHAVSRSTLLVTSLGLVITSHASDIVKLDNAEALNTGASWTSNLVPGSGDVAVWDSTVSVDNSVELGGDLSWNGIRVASPGGAVAIGGANTLTLGSAGIDMSGATQNLTLANALTLLGSTQTWNVSTGQNLTVNGVLGGSGSLNKSGAGTVTLGGNNIFSTGVLVNGGTLSLSNGGALNSTTPDNVTLNANDTILQAVKGLGSGTANVGSIAVSSNVTGAKLVIDNSGASASTGFNLASGSTLTLNSPLTVSYVNNAGQQLRVEGRQITGSGVSAGQDALIFESTGTAGSQYFIMNAAANNDFTGNVHVKTGSWRAEGWNGFLPGSHQFFPAASMLTLDSGTTWQWNNASAAFVQTIDGLAGGGTMTKNAINYTLNINANNPANDGNRIFTGSLSNMAGTLTLGGSGTQEFSGATPSFTNATALNNGTLKLTKTSAWGSNITFGASNSPKVQLNAPLAADVWSFGKSISGTNSNAGMEKIGAGTVTLTTAQSYAGATAVTGGSLMLQSTLAAPNQPYRYFKFQTNSTQGGGIVQLSELAFYTTGTNPTGSTRVIPTAYSGGGTFSAAESPAKAYDNDLNTKWCDTASGMPQSVVFDFGSPQLISGYDWASANDATPARNPNNWQVFGSSDGINWTLLDTRLAQGGTPTATKTWAAGWTLGNSIVCSLPSNGAVTVASGARLGGTGSAGDTTVAAGGAVQGGLAGNGVLTLNSLNFSGNGSLSATPSASAASLVITNALTTSGGANSVAVSVEGGAKPDGTYHLVQYGSLGGSLGDYQISPQIRSMSLANNAPYIDVVVANTGEYPIWTGGGGGEWSYNTGLGNWKNSIGGAATGFMKNDNVLFDGSVGAGTTNINVSTTDVSPGVMTFDFNSPVAYTLGGTKDILTGSLVKSGNGTLTITGGFSFPGGSTLNGGTVTMSSAAGLGTGGRIINGGTLEYTGATGTMSGSTTLGSSGGTIKVTDSAAVLTQAGSLAPGSSGSLTKDGPGTLVLPLTTGTYANPIQIADGTLNLNHGSSAAVCSGNITGAASGILRLDGTGADANNGLTLTGNNTFSGATHIYGRRLFLNSPVGNAISGNIVVKGPTWPSHGLTLLRDEQIADTAVLSFESFIGDYDFRLNGKTETLAGIASLDDTGIVENAGSDGSNDTGIANPGTLIVSGPDSYSFFGALRNQSGGTNGALQFTKSGTGTQTLSGTGITYTGPTTINAGTLNLTDATAFNSNVTMNGGTLVLNSTSGAWNFPKVIAAGSGAGNVKITGSGTVTLAGANTYTGTTTIESGTLNVTGSITGSPLVDVQAIGTLSGAIAASGQTVQGTGTLIGVTLGSGVTLTPGTASTIDTIHGDGTITFAAGSTCAMNVDRTGGVITNDHLDGADAIVYGGTLTVTATGQAFVAGNVVSLFPGAITYGGGFTTTNLPVLGSGLSWDLSKLTVDGSMQVVNTAPTPVFNPPAGGYIGAQTLTISSSSGSTIYYTLDGSTPTTSSPNGPSPITSVTIPTNSNVTVKAFAKKTGQADSPVTTSVYHTLDLPVWTLDASGSWQDSINWQGGVLAQGNGVIADFSTLTTSGDNEVWLDGPRTVGQLIFGDQGNQFGWALSTGTSGTLTLNNGASSPVVNVINQTATISAPVASGNGLVKTGTGTLVLNDVNSVSGTLAVRQGTLEANNAGAFGAATNAVTLGDASTGINPVGLSIGSGVAGPVNLSSITNSNFGASQQITLNAGSGLGANAAALVTALNLNGSVPVTLKALNTGGHSTAQDVNWRITGTGIPAGATALVLDGSAYAVRMSQLSDTSAASNFTGDVLIKGPVTTQGRTYLTNTAENQNLNFLHNNITVESGTWNIVWGGETIGALNGAGNLNLNCQSALNNIGLTLGNNNMAGTHTGVISGGFALSKVGTGNQTLGGANTYSGGTTVNAGTLTLTNTTGSGTGSGAVTVKSGATLAGTGIASNTTTVETGGTVAPGASGTGTLTLATASMAGTYQCQLDGANGDAVTVSGALTIQPGAAINVSTLGTPTAASYTILTYSTLTGTLPTITGVPSGYTVDTSTTGQVKLVGGNAFDSWINGFASLTNPADKTATADPDHDGFANIIEFVLNGDPANNAITNRPTLTASGANLVFTYTRRDDSESLAQAVEFDADMAGVWTTAVDGSNCTIVVTENGASPDTVTVTIPKGANTKLFARLKVNP